MRGLAKFLMLMLALAAMLVIGFNAGRQLPQGCESDERFIRILRGAA